MTTEPYFNHLGYLRMNMRRLEHLATLNLPLHDKTVLEIGAGIGDLTSYFLDRGCSVTSIEGRVDNVSTFESRYSNNGFWPQERLKIVCWDVAQLDSNHELTPHQIVFCYGLLYHLCDPASVIRQAAALCSEIMLVETAVAYRFHSDDIVNFAEDEKNPTNSITGDGSYPSRKWVFNRLLEHFPYVYSTVTQPCHEQFRTEWSTAEQLQGRSRAIFVASRKALDCALLLDYLPDRQFYRIES